MKYSVKNHRPSIIHLIEDLPEEGFLPINALLAVGAVHQHLVKFGLRSDANIIVRILFKWNQSIQRDI